MAYDPRWGAHARAPPGHMDGLFDRFRSSEPRGASDRAYALARLSAAARPALGGDRARSPAPARYRRRAGRPQASPSTSRPIGISCLARSPTCRCLRLDLTFRFHRPSGGSAPLADSTARHRYQLAAVRNGRHFFAAAGELLGGGQLLRPVNELKPAPNPVVVHGQNVRPTQPENEEHLDRPWPNPPDLDQALDDRCVGHRVELGHGREGAVDRACCQIGRTARALSARDSPTARSASASIDRRASGFGWFPSNNAPRRLCRWPRQIFPVKLLVDDRLGECLERALRRREREREGPHALDERGQPSVAGSELRRGGAVVETAVDGAALAVEPAGPFADVTRGTLARGTMDPHVHASSGFATGTLGKAPRACFAATVTPR